MAQLIKTLFKPYPKKISNKLLILKWGKYFVAGFLVLSILPLLYPPFISEEQILFADFCTPLNIITVVLFPFFEATVFMILPFIWKKKRGLEVGLIIWALLHFLSAGIPIFIYISLMAIFYYKAISIKRYKSVIGLIFMLNFISVLSCL